MSENLLLVFRITNSLDQKKDHYRLTSKNYVLNLLKNKRIIKSNNFWLNSKSCSNITTNNNELNSYSKNPSINITSHLFSSVSQSKNTKLNQKANHKSSDKKDKKTLPKVPLHFIKNSNDKNKNLYKSVSYIKMNTLDKEKKDMESNFFRIKNDSNIYTANVGYITNKKMLIIDKNSYDNDIYKPDRLGMFDMADLTSDPRIKKSKFYKAAKFRLGKIFREPNLKKK